MSGDSITNSGMIVELAKAKAIFQQRAILAAMGVQPERVALTLSNSTPLEYCCHCQERHEDGELFCDICGDHHEEDNIPIPCETGDGV